MNPEVQKAELELAKEKTRDSFDYLDGKLKNNHYLVCNEHATIADFVAICDIA